MHATFVTLWLHVVQPLANIHETKWTPHVKRESDVALVYDTVLISLSLHHAGVVIAKYHQHRYDIE